MYLINITALMIMRVAV